VVDIVGLAAAVIAVEVVSDEDAAGGLASFDTSAVITCGGTSSGTNRDY
jgi:hypothetical protein